MKMSSFELGFVIAASLLGKQQAEAAERADRVKLPNEEIVCRNATIFEQHDGEISWIDNDKVSVRIDDM